MCKSFISSRMFYLYCATAIGPSNYVDDHTNKYRVCQDNETPFFYPRRACAARVTVVGLSVCVCTLILALQATRRPISGTSGFKTTRVWKIKGRFSWNDCVREICREKYNRTGLTATRSARSVYLEGSGSHNEWHVSTPACYLLL